MLFYFGPFLCILQLFQPVFAARAHPHASQQAPSGALLTGQSPFGSGMWTAAQPALATLKDKEKR